MQFNARQKQVTIPRSYAPIRMTLLSMMLIIFMLAGLAPDAQASIFNIPKRWPTDPGSGYTIIPVCIDENSSVVEKNSGATRHDPNPSLDVVVGKIRNALRLNWEWHSSVRFVGWELCNTVSPRENYVPIYINKDAKNNSRLGIDAKGDYRLNDATSFKPWGDPDIDVDCITYNAKRTKSEYSFECVQSYGLHELGHALGFRHEWQHPLTTQPCSSLHISDGERPLKAPNYSADEIKQNNIVNPDVYDWNSLMTYDDACAHKTGVRFGSPGLSPIDIQGVQAIYGGPKENGINDVGVIPDKHGVCPAGTQVVIHLDNEDDDNNNLRAGWNGAILSDGGSTTFEFCRIDGNELGNLLPSPGTDKRTGDYAVLKLGKQCPRGSTQFVRRFDDEDDRNENWMAGSAGENISERDTTLEFCLFQPERLANSWLMTEFPNLGFEYGVIAAADFMKAQAGQTGYVRTDDEDDHNKNTLIRIPSDDAAIARVMQYNLDGAGWTQFLLAKVQVDSGIGKTFVVNSTGDTYDGFCDPLGVGTGNKACTLRDANRVAGGSVAPDRITFANTLNGETIFLTSGVPFEIARDVTIDASNLADGITLSGNNATRVLFIYEGARVSLNGLNIADGYSTGPGGGGVWNRGILTVTNATISNNLSLDGGAGIFNDGTLVMENCTIVNNKVFDGSSLGLGSRGGGGGILNIFHPFGQPVHLTLRHCTVANNKAENIKLNSGGGIENLLGAAALTIENSIIANNLNYQNQPADLLGDYTTKGANIIEAPGGASPVGPAPLTVDPLLEPLAKIGNAPETMRLSANSPAIDKASPSALTRDQLGLPRQIGAAPDLGAVESLITNLSPTSGKTNVAIQGTTLTWSGPPNAIFQLFFSGTGSGSTTPSLPLLTPNTEYRWRVDTTIKGHTYTGATQSFTTRGALVVTTLLDENDEALGLGSGDSLRETLAAAITGETITFAPELSGQTIHLGGTQLDITKNLTLDAAALVEGITIDGSGISRVLAISSASTVTLKKLTLSGGNAALGGGINNQSAALTLEDSTVTGNRSSDKGGGIYNGGGSLTLLQSTISKNSANEGSGLFIASGALWLEDVTIADNELAVTGSGIYFNGANLTLRQSTVSGNAASGKGGGLFIGGGTVLIENSTLAGNTSGSGEGGGIWNQGGASVSLRHATVVGNVGAGIYNAASLTLANSIVANNFNNVNVPSDIQGNFTTTGANLVRVAGGQQSGDAPITTDPKLKDLDFYGGSTKTMPPVGGSPVINTGATLAQPLDRDQRGGGYPRPNGIAPDIGAIESTLDSNADLFALTTSAGSLDPAFLPAISEYTVKAPNLVTSAFVRATRMRGDASMQVRINGGSFTALNDGEVSLELALTAGATTVNSIEVKVIAQDGTPRTYTLSIVRDTADATLSALTTTSGALSPAFDAATVEYNTTVANATPETSVTPTAADPASIITIYDDFAAFTHTVASGAASPALPLKVGANPFNIKVTARDGESTFVYRLIVTRQAPAAANADLTALTTSAGSLHPNFSSGVTLYRLNVADSVTNLSLTPTVSQVVAQAGATISVRANGGNFSAVGSGAASSPMALVAGDNTIEVKVTAQDGVTVKSYKVIVTQFVDNLYWAQQGANPSIASNGYTVAYASAGQIYVYDRSNGTTELVSKSDSGSQGNFESANPSISADGRYVAFESESTNLVANDNNGNVERSQGRDIFIFDRTTKTMQRVSLRENGGEANLASGSPSLSGDGRYVAFVSNANNLVSGFVTGSGGNVYVVEVLDANGAQHDRSSANKIVGIVVPFNQIANRDSLNPAFSTDGNYVAFEFGVDKSIENGNDAYVYTDIYLYNRETLTVQRITGGNIAENADGTDSRNPSISADGRYVAYQSNLASIDFYDTNNAVDVFVYDRLIGKSKRVSLDAAGVEGSVSQESTNPAISGDGRSVAFESRVDSFVTPDSGGFSDIFMKEVATGKITKLSVNAALAQGNNDSASPSVSFDGLSVAFQSNATNLTGDNSGGIFMAVTEPLAPSAVADLSLLTTSEGSIGQGFSAGVNAYTTHVGNDVESILIKPVAAQAGATVSVQQVNANGLLVEASAANGGVIAPDTTPSPLQLAVGDNVIEVKVTAEDGSTVKSYMMTVKRAGSNNAALSSLALSTDVFLALAPDFASNTKAYAVSVANANQTANIVPTAAQANATITVNGKAVASGGSSVVPLNVGSNTITVKVTAEDGSTLAQYVVTVTREPNTPPVAATQTVTISEAAGVALTLNGTDDDGNALAYSIVTQPTQGTLLGTAPNLTYVQNAGYVGNDSFSFKVNDGVVDSAAVAVALKIVMNRQPTAVNDTATTAQGQPITINVLPNDSDPDGGSLTVSLSRLPDHGAASVISNSILYTPTVGFNGEDSLLYIVKDDNGGTADATVTITVGEGNSGGSQNVYLPLISR